MELNRVNTGAMVLERVNLLTRVEVPKLNCTVIGTRCNKASVWRELARFNPVLMGLWNRENEFTVRGLEDFEGLVI